MKHLLALPAVAVCLVLSVGCVAAGRSAGDEPVAIGPRGFTVTTARLEAVFRDGAIVNLVDRRTGEVHADQALESLNVPRGLGHLTGDVASLTKLHMPWGTRSLNQHLEAGQAWPVMHHPYEKSTFAAEPIDGGVRGTWTGLTNGAKEFPRETLTVEARVDDASGCLLVTASGTSPDGGVYGVQVPILNLHKDHSLYVPSFGGVKYTADMKPGLTTLGKAPFWEAPVVAAEGRKGSVGLWVEDDTFRTNYFFSNFDGKAFSMAIEHIELMPFEKLKRTESVTWRVDVFKGGWVDAMTPYRDWYHKTFAKELAVRNTVGWADDIRVVIDNLQRDPETLRVIANYFEPAHVLLHDWNGRAPRFDHDLPDWTPRKGYVTTVKTAQAFGFHTMAYVNTYCVNYNSPVFKRDHIASFGLPRLIRGIWRYNKEAPTFETAKDGQLMYLDPLSPKWRDYHTDMMIDWRKTTGTDANYEDVAGTGGDFGNGVVEGLSAGQGAMAQFQQLLQRNPTVPMASEFCPDYMAFAARWPLRYQQVWGGDATRVWWMKHQRPVSAYIHGPKQRAWIPTINAETNFRHHLVAACSDALGGMAQVDGKEQALRATSGSYQHLLWRARLFSSRQLEPTFVKEMQSPETACLYADRDGAVYRYTTTDTVQRMSGPDGKPLYERVTGVNRFESQLALPGWPAVTERVWTGLDPSRRYALQPGVPDRTAVRVAGLPEGVKLGRYYATDKFVVLRFDPLDEGAPEKATVQLMPQRKVRRAYVNGKAVAELAIDPKKAQGKSAAVETAFPATVLLATGGWKTPRYDQYFPRDWEYRHYVNEAGLDRGGTYDRELFASFPVPGVKGNVPFAFVNHGGDSEVTVDYLIYVPTAVSTLELFVRNRQTRYGNGAVAKVYVNGGEVHAFDFGPVKNPDWTEGMPSEQKTIWNGGTDVQAWRIPLGAYAKQVVLISLANNSKGGNNSDSLWFSSPRIVKDQEQKVVYEVRKP